MKKIAKWWSMFALGLILVSPQAHALTGFYVDLNAFAGYSSPEVNKEALADPDMGSFGGGITLGLQIIPKIFFLGVSSDYRIVNQYSVVDPKVGNFAGKRWNMASPTIGFTIGGVVIKVDGQILGNYELRNQTADGETVSYESPIGGRVAILLPKKLLFNLPVNIGVYAEQVRYAEIKGSAFGKTDLSPKFTQTSGGLMVAYVF